MKKFFSIFFLAIFLFNTMGYFVLFQLEQFAAKEEMRQNIQLGLPDSRITTLTVDNATLATLLKGSEDEFTYNGKKYDLVKKESANDHTVLYAINDTKEDHLFSSLNDQFQSNDLQKPAKHPDTKNLTKLIKTDYFKRSGALFTALAITSIAFPNAELLYSSTRPEAILLPPKTA